MLLANLKSKAALQNQDGQYRSRAVAHAAEVIRPAGGGPSLRAEAEAARRALEEDNKELKAELLAARRLLHEQTQGGRLKGH